MVSPWVPIVMLVLGLLMLFTTSILATIAAANSYGSPSYSSDKKIQSAHSYLTAAASIGFVSVAIFLLIIVFSIYISQRDGVDINALKEIAASTNRVTKAQYLELINSSKALEHFRRSFKYVMFAVGLLIVLNVIVGVLCAIAAANLASATKDNSTKSAYTLSIIAAILGIPTVILSVVTIVLGVKLSNSDAKIQNKIDEGLGTRKAQTTPA